MSQPSEPPSIAEPATPAAAHTRPSGSAPRWLVVVAWSSGPAALYALLGLAHAAVVERSLTLDVGFGRSLAFWVGTVYLALPLWAFLSARPSGWYARRGAIGAASTVGGLGLLVCGGFTVVWSLARWNGRVGLPIVLSLIALAATAGLTLWFAAREEPAEA